MNPPFKITNEILELISSISLTVGKIEGSYLKAPEPKLRKQNKIKTIQATLGIEGNTLSLDQVTAVLDGKRVLGHEREILEVKNANKLYESMDDYKINNVQDLLNAHQTLMKGLVDSSGSFRNKNVGVLKGTKVSHVAPKPKLVPELVCNLFNWIEDEEVNLLIKSCIVHYELEFIHPFEDGNGRIGRFWQSLILYNFNSIFKFIPIESLIKENQEKYYSVLEECDKAGESTVFISFMLSILDQCLIEYIEQYSNRTLTASERLDFAKGKFKDCEFSRKEYMNIYKNVSSATASRDLKEGCDFKILQKTGSGNQTRYHFKL